MQEETKTKIQGTVATLTLWLLGIWLYYLAFGIDWKSTILTIGGTFSVAIGNKIWKDMKGGVNANKKSDR